MNAIHQDNDSHGALRHTTIIFSLLTRDPTPLVYLKHLNFSMLASQT